MPIETLLGDEAIALGAVHAGLSAAYAYPGTPSTEIMECLQDLAATRSGPLAFTAQWCANEKTAYEAALGASWAGRRATVSMKHVGLNVAMDPFTNSALLHINGGLVVIVADDPGMHSSQDEQDSRVLADFAKVPCLEPADQQEAYDLMAEAFALSESRHCPVMVRLTTRLAHARAGVMTGPERAQNPVRKDPNRWGWTLMPAAARPQWKATIQGYAALRREWEAASTIEAGSSELGVVTAGLALQYYRENLPDLAAAPTHLHIGRYPIPQGALRDLASRVKAILVLEDGYPYVEESLLGTFGSPVPVRGKLSGDLPRDGELSPDLVRKALGLPERPRLAPADPDLPRRLPQLCQGCPHADSYAFIKEALAGTESYTVNSDIGCYTLGALPPHEAIETCVDMGASIGMARGAAEAGLTPAIAVIGDSTFYHSGLPNLIDAVSHHSNLTVVILDNSTTGMTGAQPTILPEERLRGIVLAVGVAEGHVHVIDAHKRAREANVALLKAEFAHEGPSVIIAVRPCLEALKKGRSA